MGLYIGLMSGTSADGIDAALVDIESTHLKLIDTHYLPYDESIRAKILALCETGENEIARMAELDVMLGRLFARAVKSLLEQTNLSTTQIKAIGSHGQTLRHAPNHDYPYTLQIGDPNIIATYTNILTVSDFRRKDIALGGQGAPLVPAFHEYLWASSTVNRVIVNIGGIANVTLLSKNKDQVIGFDTGPGNVLLDSWVQSQKQKNYDEDGKWAVTGKINPDLLQQMLMDEYFHLKAPKSTGREYFNLTWLHKQLEKFATPINPADIQATLAELTATTVLDAIKIYFPKAEIFICGGGAYNKYLLQRLQEIGSDSYQIDTTLRTGLAPEWVEATAFAWLAHQTMQNKPGNLPSVTNAKRSAILGGIYLA